MGQLDDQRPVPGILPGLGVLAAATILAITSPDLPADDLAVVMDRPPAEQRARIQSVPGCAETAVFSLLHALGKGATFAKIRSTLASLAPDRDFDPRQVSMKHLRDVLARHGVPTSAIRNRSRSLSQLRTPCILYVRTDGPSDGPAAAGHFVTFIGWRQENAVVLDWSPNSVDPEFEVPAGQLQSIWKGEAIVPRGGSLVESFGVPTMYVLSALCLAFVWMPVRKPAATICLAALLLSVSGCSDSKGAVSREGAVPTLLFEQPVRSLNSLAKGKSTDVKFPFKVWNRSSVRIASIERGCGCVELVKDLTNHTLEPDSSHALEVRFKPQGSGGENGVQRIELLTDPPSPTPLILMLSYRLAEELIISEAAIVVEANPGEAPAKSLRATYYRSAAKPPLKLDLSRSSAQQFVIRPQGPVVTEPNPRGNTVTDTLELRLDAQRPFEIGRHAGKVTLAFANGETRTLESTIVVGHPFQPRLSDVFVGRLRPGESWHKEVPVDGRAPVRLTSNEIVSDRNIVAAEITATPSVLLNGRAPSEPGKFSSVVEFRFDSQKLPAVKINVWGIVTN